MITQEQIKLFIVELLKLNREIKLNNLNCPTLKFDRNTYRDLEDAMIQYCHLAGPISDTFFHYPPRIMGFEIEFKQAAA